ncbi:hypothetical protein WJX81_000656 [Elliptochloris bilobata]|uniref:Nucleolar protein 14 n=1 Tax=Elliptochloris bilobata TaxID=381761 RepID=A0AAW1RZ86_9CHLO
MAKRRKAPRKAQQAAAAAVSKPAAASNPFERLHSRKKFAILGKRAKGEQRPSGKLRSEAVEKREKTLLVEYKQLRKANAFIDRRFGEDDDTLTAEEKAVARFQKERMKAIGGDRFALGDGEGEELTHLGRFLSEGGLGEAPESSDSDEDGGALDDAVVREFHFGGGFVRKEGAADVSAGSTGAEQDPERRRTKKEVMEEVMAKSKAARSAKREQRAEDLDATDALDAQFAALVAQGGLADLVRPKGSRRDRVAAAAAAAAQAAEDIVFDRARRELVFEAKATVGDRTHTAEELAEAEAQRLQALEAARQRRMRAAPAGVGGDDPDDDCEAAGDKDAAAPAGGYAARRHKRRRAEAAGPSGDALEDDFEVSDGDRGGSGDGSGSEDGEDEDTDEDGGAATGLQARQAARAAGAHPLQQSLRAASAALLRKYGAGAAGGGAGARGAELGSSDAVKASLAALPYLLGLPASYEEFAALVAGRPAEELSAAMGRMRACNAAALSADNRRRLQEFYGVLVQHFALRAGARPLPLDELDVLTVHLLALTPEVPVYAATVARARLQRLLDRLAAALRGSPADGASAWPGARGLLLLKLWATLFPASDRRHAVLTPAALVAGACLALCPLARASDVAQGLFLASLALHLTAPAQRLAPEALTFAVFGKAAALPELLAPAMSALRALGAAGLPQALETQRRGALAALEAAAAARIAARRPLQRRGATSAALARAPAAKMYNPRFEEDYAAGRDNDPDRERAEQRRLKRQLQKEKRGAMRELRKDAVFIGGVRQAEAAAAAAELRGTRRANFAILEQQEADARSGGQGGMFKSRKRGHK